MSKLKRFMNQPTMGFKKISDNNSAEEFVRKIENHRGQYPIEQRTWFDKLLDFLGQPMLIYAASDKEAESYSKIINGYWGAVKKSNRPEIHQHVHIHKGELEEW